MALAAIVALLHDLLVAAGVYSIIGFEVTPSTVVGLLTILGFSLYDTVVVFDKVAENTKDLTAGSRSTYSEAANLAVNQTLMRSINTSLIALLPVAGLLFVGALILGVGTIKDLALILFVGLASGAYSSLFLATPVVCELTEREPAYKALTKRVAAKRASERAAAAKLGLDPNLVGSVRAAGPVRRGSGAAPAPKPGARPQTRPRKR
jgi:preprotein translocase subunit SecF